MSKSLLRSAFIVTGLGVLTRILSFLFRIYLSRKIGAESLGVYQIALSVFFLFSTLTAGLPLTISRKTAEMQALGRFKGEKSFTTATIIVGFSVSCAVVVGFLLLSNHLSFLFSDVRCMPLFLILLPSCISTALYGIIRGWFWGKKRYEVFALTEFFECVVRIILGVVLISGVVDGINGATGTAISFTISDYVCTALIIVLFFVYGGRIGKPSGFKKLTRTAIPLTAVRLYNSLVNSVIAILVPALLISTGIESNDAMADYGRIMGMALPLIMSPAMLTGALNTVLVPEIATLKAKGDLDNLTKKIKSSLTIAVTCALLFFVIFVPLGEKIGYLFYEDKIAGTYVSYSAIIMVGVVLNGVTSTVMDSIGLEMSTMKNFIIGSVFMIASLLIFSRFVGAYCIIIAYGTSYLITTLLNLKAIKKKLNVSYKNLASTLIIEHIIAIVGILGTIFIKNLTDDLPLVASIVIPAIFGVAFFMIAVLAFNILDLSGFIQKRKKSAKPT